MSEPLEPSNAQRDWRPDEQALIDAKPARWHRQWKLSAEQVKEIRRRTDSLTIPWTFAELAAEYGVWPQQVYRIAKREEWPERRFEPEGRQWWKEKEIEEMLEE